MRRRKFLLATAATLSAAIAGCAEEGPGDEESTENDGDQDDEETESSDGDSVDGDDGEEEESTDESDDAESDESEEGSDGEGEDNSGENSEESEDVDDPEDEHVTTPEEFEAALDALHDGDVQSYEQDGDYGFLSITSVSFGDQNQMASEIGQVAGAYAAYVEHGDAPAEALEVEVLNFDATRTAGNYTVQTEWAEQFNTEEISNTEYSQLVLETIEVAEQASLNRNSLNANVVSAAVAGAGR